MLCRGNHTLFHCLKARINLILMTLEREGKTHAENVTQRLSSFVGTLRDTPKTAAKDTKKSGDP